MRSYANIHVAPCSHNHQPVCKCFSYLHSPRVVLRGQCHHPLNCINIQRLWSDASRLLVSCLLHGDAARSADHSHHNLCDVLNVGERGEDLTNGRALPPRAPRPDKATPQPRDQIRDFICQDSQLHFSSGGKSGESVSAVKGYLLERDQDEISVLLPRTEKVLVSARLCSSAFLPRSQLMPSW